MKNENIDNLTSLWKTAGNAFNSYFEMPDFNYSIIENSEWPNRLWFNENIDLEKLVLAKKFMSGNSLSLRLPVWDFSNSQLNEIFESTGFELKFKQAGMSLQLNNKFEFEKRLVINIISSDAEAQIWEDIYPISFGYKISKETVLATKGKIEYYLAYQNGNPIGTAIIYRINNIAGIHGVGVIPSARRKGFAEEIMKHVINISIDAGMKYSTLQASDMGKGIYLRLGYSDDFQISNYGLK